MPQIPFVTRPSRLLLGLVGLAATTTLSAVFGCARGELRLTSETSQAGATATGGDASSGGTSGASGGSSTGGTDAENPPCSGLDCPPCEGPDCRDEPDRACQEGTAACPSCKEDTDCPPFAPLCGAGNECRQCRDDGHCIALYGGERPICWGGWCASCTSNEDCPFELTCTAGRCGVCSGDGECPSDLVCRQGTCRPS